VERDAPPTLYSPKCLEGEFSEGREQLSRVNPFEPPTDTRDEGSHFLLGYIKHAATPAGPGALLILVGHARPAESRFPLAGHGTLVRDVW